MKITKRTLLATLATTIACGSFAFATPTEEEPLPLEPKFEFFVEFGEWSESLLLEADGDVELLSGQQLGEWKAVHNEVTGADTIVIDLGGTSASVELDLDNDPSEGDIGPGRLFLGGTLTDGWYQIITLPFFPCVKPRVETACQLDAGTEQWFPGTPNEIKRVIKVTKCGRMWHEVETIGGGRFLLSGYAAGNVNNTKGSGQVAHNNRVSFVAFKP